MTLINAGASWAVVGSVLIDAGSPINAGSLYDGVSRSVF